MRSRESSSFSAVAQKLDGIVEPVDLGVIVNPTIDLTYFDARVLYSQCVRCIRTAQGGLLSGDETAAVEAVGAPGVLNSIFLDIVLDMLGEDPRAVLGLDVSCALANPEAWRKILHKIEERSDLAHRLVLEFSDAVVLPMLSRTAQELAVARSTGCQLAIANPRRAAGYRGNHLPDLRLFLEANAPWTIVRIGPDCFDFLSQTALGRDHLSFFVASARAHASTVVVEGIDSPSHLAVARHAGVQFGQGELFRHGEVPRWFAGHDNKTKDLRVVDARPRPGAPSPRHAGPWPQGNPDR